MPIVIRIRLNRTERNVTKMAPNASMPIARTRIHRSGVDSLLLEFSFVLPPIRSAHSYCFHFYQYRLFQPEKLHQYYCGTVCQLLFGRYWILKFLFLFIFFQILILNAFTSSSLPDFGKNLLNLFFW